MKNLFNLDGKNILISGATGVLGTQITSYVAAHGANLFLLGRSEEKLLNLKSKIPNTQIKILVADVMDESALAKVAKELSNEINAIDVMINLAGGNMPGAVIRPDQTLEDLDAGALKKVMELNYQGTLLPIKAFLPLLNGGHPVSIINTSSMAAQRPLTRVMGYSSAKAAIDNLTKWLAVEFAQKYGPNMRVNAIAPGFFLTEQNRALLTEVNGALTVRGQQIIAHTPMGRFGEDEDLLGTVHWLASDASKFVTGVIIPIDGGFNAYSGV